MSEIIKQETETEKLQREAAEKERQRLTMLILSNSASMAAEYRHTIKHTGGLLTKSMTYAYSKALNDVFKLLTKGSDNEKPVQE